MDRGAWWATVHRVTKSQTRLKRLSTHTAFKAGVYPSISIIHNSKDQIRNPGFQILFFYPKNTNNCMKQLIFL